MPIIDIQHAVALIQSVEGLRTVPLVVMVSSKGEKEQLRTYNLNVSGYIRKPVNGQILKRFLKIR
jgi:CheY-like chemotaxis protein